MKTDRISGASAKSWFGSRLTGATCLLGIAVLAAPSNAADWSQWRGADRNGVDAASPRLIDQLPTDGLKAQWLSETIPAGGNGGWGSPVIADNKVYVFSHFQSPKEGVRLESPRFPGLSELDRARMTPEETEAYDRCHQEEERERRIASHDFKEILYCFDLGNGETLWKNERPSLLTDFFQSGTPAIVDGKAYVLGAGGMARAINCQTGADVWQTQLPGDFRQQYHSSSFAVADGVAAILAGHLYGVDSETGALLWEGDAGKTSGAHSSPVVWQSAGKSWLIANIAGQDTACFSPRDGAEAWRVSSGANLSTPVVVGDRMLTYASDKAHGLKMYKLSPTAAELLWTYQGAVDSGSSPLILGGSVYLQGGKRLACVDLKTGKAAWTARLMVENAQYTSPIAADGKVFYTFGGVMWFKATPTRYEILATARINQQGLMASDETFRRLLKVDAAADASSERAAEAMQNHTAPYGPLDCSSPAIADGRLIIRRNQSIVCYDLRAQARLARKKSPGATEK